MKEHVFYPSLSRQKISMSTPLINVTYLFIFSAITGNSHKGERLFCLYVDELES